MTATIQETPAVTTAEVSRPARSSLVWALATRQKTALSRLSLLVFLQVNAAQHVASFTRALLDRVVFAQAQAPGAFIARGFVWAVLLGVAAMLCARSTARMIDVLEHDLRMWSFTRVTHQTGADRDAIAAPAPRTLIASDHIVAAAHAARRALLLVPFVLAPVFVTAKAMPVASVVFLAAVGGLAASVPRARQPRILGVIGTALTLAVAGAATAFLHSGHHIWPVRSRVSDGMLLVFLQAAIAVVPLGAALIRVGERRAPVLDAQDELEEIFAQATAPSSWGAGLPPRDARLRVAFRGERFDLKPGQTLVVHAPDERTRTRLAHAVAGLEASTSAEVTLGDVAVTDLDPSARLDAIRFLTEHPLLVPGTVTDNLSLGRADVPIAAQLDAACHAAGLRIDATPAPIDDFDTAFEPPVRQRLALARGLLGDPRVLVFDDGLSSLSGADAAAVLRAVRAEAPDAIVVYVTTRRLPVPGARTANVPSLNGHGPSVLRHGIPQEPSNRRLAAGLGGAKVRPGLAGALVATGAALFLAQAQALGVVARLGGVLVVTVAPLVALWRWANAYDAATREQLRDRFVVDVALGRAGGYEEAVRERFASEHWDALRARALARTLAGAAYGVMQVLAVMMPMLVLGALADQRFSVNPATLASAGMVATILGAALRNAMLDLEARS